MSDDVPFAIGDRVTWQEGEKHWTSWRWGTVSRVSSGGGLVEVRPDIRALLIKQFRRRRDGWWPIRKASPDELAVEAWQKTEPETAMAWAQRDLSGAVSGLLRCRDAMDAVGARQAARELVMLADWLDSKPRIEP